MIQYFDWTDAHIARLKELWTEGLSATHIAARMGQGLTRNSVIGKIHRLGLQTRSAIRRAPIKPKVKAATPSVAPAVKPKPPVPMLAPLPVVIEAEPGERRGLQVADLEPHHCRWPIGDPLSPDFSFCGNERRDDKSPPYCEFHARLATTTARAYAPWTPQHKREQRAKLLQGR